MHSITDLLTISDAPSTRDLSDDHEFDRVITLGYYDGMGYEKPAASTDEHVFRDGPHDYPDFKTAVDTTREALANGQNTLVHCQAGVSRSAAVCSAVLAVENDILLDDAFNQVKQARPNVNPTPELWESARRYVREADSGTTAFPDY